MSAPVADGLAVTTEPTRAAGGRVRSRSHLALVGVAGGLLAYQVAKLILWLSDWPRVVALFTDSDHAIYMAAAARIRGGGTLYPDFQFAPYTMDQLPELYPPTTMYGLVVPMSYLPDLLWWAIPLAVVAATVWYWCE